MFKQLLIIFVLVSFFGAFTLAQEQVDSEKKEKQECSKSCCAKKEMHSDMKMDDSKETHRNMEHMQSDNTMQGMHHNMKMDNSTATEIGGIWNKVCPVKGEEVDAEAPTVEYNGKVIGFCCPGCDSKFQKDPEKYMKNLNEDGTEFIGS